MKAKVAVYHSHEHAIEALKALAKHNFDMKTVSLVGQAEATDDHLHINHTRALETAPVLIGTSAGIITGLLSGIGVFTIPGFGFLYGAGALVGAIGGFELGVYGGGLISILVGLGIHQDHASKYEEHLKTGNFMVVVQGSEEQIIEAEKILHTEGRHLEME